MVNGIKFKNNFNKPLAEIKKSLYTITMMKTIHTFTQQPQTSLWSAVYCPEKSLDSGNAIIGGGSGD